MIKDVVKKEMRSEVTKEKLMVFLKHFGNALNNEGRIYLTGGASALLYDWRSATIDVGLKADPEPKNFFEIIARTKDQLDINLELAAPDQFIPELPGWPNRSVFIDRFGKTDFYHYDFYSQALAKLERGHPRDKIDVEAMFRDGFIKTERLSELFQAIEERLIKFPAIEIPDYKKTVSDWCKIHQK